MQTIRLDISQKNNVPLIYVKQRDVGHKFVIELYENGKIYTVDENYTCAVWYSGESGEGNYTHIGEKVACEIEGNKITVEMIVQMLNEPGGHEMCVVVYDPYNKQKGFWNIPYFVEAIPGADSKGATAYYQAFLQAQEKAEEAAGRAEDAAAKINVDQEYIETQVFAASGAAEVAATAARDAEAAAARAEAVAIDAVSYNPQELNPEQQAQAQMNIGVDKLCPPFTESGSSVTCEPVESYPLQVVSKIESVQSGSGHDMVQLTQSGKNLLAYPYVDTTKTVDGMTFTDNGDGSITLNGTSTSSYLSFILQSAPFADVLKDGVTYRLSTGTDDTNIAIVCYYKNESGASVWASGNMTWKKEYTLLQVYLQVTEVATYTNMVLYPQIEIGTTATAFEPYRGYTYTMDLGQEVFGGFLNWTTGVLTDSEGNVHQLNAQEIIALPGTNILYSSTGDTEVTGRADPAAIINNLLDRLAALEAAVVNNA